jgi:hypothetical protein
MTVTAFGGDLHQVGGIMVRGIYRFRSLQCPSGCERQFESDSSICSLAAQSTIIGFASCVYASGPREDASICGASRDVRELYPNERLARPAACSDALQHDLLLQRS